MKKVICTAGLAVVLSSCGGGGSQPATVEATGNPFLAEYTTPFGVPPFERIKLEHYLPAFQQGIEEQAKEIRDIVNNPDEPDFNNTIVALDQSGELLRKVSYVFGGLMSANNTPEMIKLSEKVTPMLSGHRDDINLNKALFERIKTVYQNRAALGLNKEQTKLLEDTYRGFVRGGANLSEEEQAKLRVLNSEIAVLQQTFGQNVQKDTNTYQLVIEKEEDLAGLPENMVAVAAELAKDKGLVDQWIFTLHNPSVMPFLQYADNRSLREEIFKAYLDRCNHNDSTDNKQIVEQLVSKRLEKAKLMGYEDYASFVLEDRMAKHAANVYALLDEIWKPALAKAKEELADIQAEIRKEGNSFTAEGWDWRYYFKKAKKAKFDLDENEVRPYLKLENVYEGMFYVALKLYGITFSPIRDIPLPHPDAVAFECKDKDGAHLGVLYMDFFPRSSKQGGAWCGQYRPQTYVDGKRVGPVVTIVCNFTPPAPGQPALLSADEAETMFHEFGHALHNLFRDVHYYGVSGVPRDFVELPSQIMEHWVFEPEVLKVFAKHYETGEVIPAELIEKLDKSGKYGQGFITTEYLAASCLDMDYHVLKSVPANLDVMDFENKTLGKRGLIRQIPSRYRTPYFRHTMGGGGYTAGYYSYIWAEVLDSDAFEAFEETGDIFNKEMAGKFRTYVLAPGGIDDAMDMYVNFRGKEPDTTPLLKNRGLK